MSTTSTPNKPKDFMLNAALFYARRGIFIFPVHEVIFASDVAVGCTCEEYRHSQECEKAHPALYLPPGKRCANFGKCPRLRWSEKSTTDIDQIRKWWTVWPNANIGIDCGKTGWLVFDADSYKQLTDISDLLSMEDRQTVTVLTGGGGEHFIYDRQGKSYGNSTKGLPAGIDIRGVGGYIVAPPSLHKSGRRYQFEEGYNPLQSPLLPIPATLDYILSSCTIGRTTSAQGIAETDCESVSRSESLVKGFLERTGIETFGEKTFNQAGRKWVLKTCPFNPVDDPHAEDASSFITINDTGAIAAGCHHNRCRNLINQHDRSGWNLLKLIFAAQPPAQPNQEAIEELDFEPDFEGPDFDEFAPPMPPDLDFEIDYFAPPDLDFEIDFAPPGIDTELRRLAEEELAKKMKAKEEEDRERLIQLRTQTFFRRAWL